jgi:cell division initiation protein
MSYAPVELRHVPLKRGLFGYKRSGVDTVLDDIATSYETVWRERAQLTDRVEQLEGELARHRELEQLLRATLVSAEQAAQRLKEDGRAEVATMVEEARLEAREITRRARAERDALVLDARRIRLMLNAALDAVDEADVAQAEPAAEDGQAEAEAA